MSVLAITFVAASGVCFAAGLAVLLGGKGAR